MAPSPDGLVKVSGFVMSSDDEISRINLVKTVDALTEAPQRRAIRRNSDLNRDESICSSAVPPAVHDADIQSDTDSTTSEDLGPYAPINDPIRKGDRVLVKGKYKGICRFIGPIQEKRTSDERFVGVQLDEKMTRFSGVFGTKQYFDCPYGYGLMVTFKNVRKYKECSPPAPAPKQSKPRPDWEKTTTMRTVSNKSSNDFHRSGSDETNSSFGLSLPSAFLYRENEKGWRVSPGHDRVKKTKSRCSLGSIKSRGSPSVRSTKSADVFDKQGTMEILDMYKNMQDSFRSLPAYAPPTHEEREYFNPGKFYKFKPFYYHNDLGPMRCNLDEKNVSVDCPNPEWDQMRQSFQMIVRENQVAEQQEIPEYHDPMMDRFYFPCDSEGFISRRFSSTSRGTRSRDSFDSFGSRDSFERQESIEEPIKMAKSISCTRVSSRRCSSLGRVPNVGGLKEIKCPKIKPIRVRKYFEKESDSSGIYDSEESHENQPIIHKYYNSSSRRSSKHSVKSVPKKSTLKHESFKPTVLTPPPLSFEQRKVCNGQCKINTPNSSRSATPILQSFAILNDDCETKMCDNCGDQKLASLGKIRKQKGKKINREDSQSSVEPMSSKNDPENLPREPSRDSIQSFESDEREIQFTDQDIKNENEIKSVSNLVVNLPNICEKWAEKHGQELVGQAKGLAKLTQAIVEV